MRRSLSTALLALVLTLVVCASASAEHDTFRFGVTELPERSEQDLSEMGSTGVDVLRVNFSWFRIETARPTTNNNGCAGARYDWDEYDPLVREASRTGVQLLPIIVGSPNYVAAQSTHAPYTRDAGEMVAYRCFVAHLVHRYGAGGTFPTENPGVRPITKWQMWNEPNLRQFGTEELGVNPPEYARLVEITSEVIRAQDPAATRILAGLPGNPDSFLRQFYTHPGIESSFEAVALHPYAVNHQGVKGSILRTRGVLASEGDRRTPIWITETGWGTQGRPGELEFIQTTQAGQAELLRRTFAMLRRNQNEWRIGTVAWFRWRDDAAPADNAPVFRYTGIYAQNGAPKPSCRTYIRFSLGGCAQLVP